MRLGSHGSYGARATLALGAVLAALATACGGSGSGGGGAAAGSLSAQLLPVPIPGASGAHGDVVFTGSGNALVVGGDLDTIFRVSRADGSVSVSTSGVGAGMGGGNLLALANPDSSVVYAGDDEGNIWEVQAGASTLLVDVGTGPVNAMAIAPEGFGALGGDLIVASQAEGLRSYDPQTLAQTSLDADPYSDIAFDGTTLYAADYANGRIVTVTAGGTVTPFDTGGLVQPEGLAVDAVNGQLLVADAGDDVLKSVSLTTGDVTELAAYDFEAGSLPSGMAFDGDGTLVFLTAGSAAGSLFVRGVGIPGYAALDFPVNLLGSNQGFGALALDRAGDLVGTANGNDTNRVFLVPRDGSAPSTLASDLGTPAGGELLFGIAHDAATSTTYVGTSEGNVFAVNAMGTSLFATIAGEAVLGLAIAPQTFAPFGGDLVAATNAGNLWAIDIGTSSATNFASLGGAAVLSDLVFAGDGTLYVADFGNAEVIRVDSAGTTTLVTSALPAPDGIALDEGGSRLFVTDSSDDELVAVALPGGGTTTLQPFVFSLGTAPSGIVFDGLGSVLVMTGDGAATVRHHPVFP